MPTSGPSSPGPILSALLLSSLAGAAAPAGAQAVSELSERPLAVTGVVFRDDDGDGTRDPGEPGLAGVGVSNQVDVTTTDEEGRFALSSPSYGVVFVVRPDGYAPTGPFWTRVGDGDRVSFGLTPAETPTRFTFVHASDPHVSEESVGRLRRFREMVDSIGPAFVILTGDLVRDALRVDESEARSYYDLLLAELARFPVPVHTVPGNHEKFGIERHSSLVSPDHPLYGNRMYRSYLGPNYHAFAYGGVHFLGLDTVDYDDQWYHGHVDDVQLAWMRAEMERIGPDRPVVTFNHIPFVSGGDPRIGFREEGLAPTTIRIDGRTVFRHTVYNHEAALTAVGPRLEVALGGHIHMRESLLYVTADGEQRLHQAAAIVGPGPEGAAGYGPISGFTVYRVEDGHVDDGTFVRLDPDPRR